MTSHRARSLASAAGAAILAVLGAVLLAGAWRQLAAPVVAAPTVVAVAPIALLTPRPDGVRAPVDPAGVAVPGRQPVEMRQHPPLTATPRPRASRRPQPRAVPRRPVSTPIAASRRALLPARVATAVVAPAAVAPTAIARAPRRLVAAPASRAATRPATVALANPALRPSRPAVKPRPSPATLLQARVRRTVPGLDVADDAAPIVVDDPDVLPELQRRRRRH